MERILHLTVTKRWFDMILSGEKLEEYREIKPYWVKRLLDEKNNFKPKQFDYVFFKNGYSKKARSMELVFKGITTGMPAFKWFGAKTDKEVFIISLGDIVNTYNLTN